MKAKKLVLCLLLSVALTVTFIPIMSFAQDEEGDVQSTDEISTAEEEIDVQVPNDVGKAEGKDAVNNVEEKTEEQAAEEKVEAKNVVEAKDWENPVTITVGSSITISGDEVFAFTPDQDGTYVFYSDYDTTTYDTDELDPDAWVEFNDNTLGSDYAYGNFYLGFNAKKGNTYYLCTVDNAENENNYSYAVGVTQGITSINVTIKPPVCGTFVQGNWYSTNTSEGDVRQKPQPQVTVPSGASYELDSYDDANYGLWYDDDWDIIVDNTLKGGTTYIARIWFRSKDESTLFGRDCEVKVTGGTLVDQWIDSYEGPGYYVVEIGVKASHNITAHYNTSGYMTNGQEYDYCSGCKQALNVIPAAGWATNYVKSMKVKKGKKSFTVKWKKQNKKNLKKFSGYQIRYSTSPDMSGAKYVNASKKSKSKKIGKLGKKTTYYVQMRSYTGGFYSGWSAVKSVKTK